MLIQTPDIVLKNAWHKISGVMKLTFFSAVIIGMITHMYMFTNTLVNHDEMNNIVGTTLWAAPGNGRWFSHYIELIHGVLTLPWIKGILSIIALALTSCLIVTMAKVKRPLYAALISGIIVTIPMVASFFTYLSAAPSNFTGILLGAIAAYLSWKFKFGFIIAPIPIMLSMAIYQTSFGVAAALMVMVLIIKVLENEATWQKMVLQGIKYLAALIAGLVLYITTLDIFIPGGLQGDYQGLGQMGQINWSYLPFQIRTAYFEIIKFFLLDSRNYHYPFMFVLFTLSFIACAALVVMWCLRIKLYREPLKVVLLSILLLLFPFACNLVFIMGPHWIHDLMIFPTVFILVFVIITVDIYLREPKSEDSAAEGNQVKKLPKLVGGISTWIITITMFVSIFNYMIISNQVYFKLNIGYQVTYAESIMLVSRIQNVEGFSPDMDIVLVGSKYIPQGIPELQNITIMGANGPELLLDSWAFPLFLQRHLNFTQNLTHVRGGDIWVGKFHGHQHIIDLVNLVEDMPIYPQNGSIKIIDDTIYVRFHHLDMPYYRPFIVD